MDSSIVTWLWELHDGTKAGVAEHADRSWELRILRRGRIVSQQHWQSLQDLVAASTAAYHAATAA
jgi:hypothetical protein